MQIHTTLRHYAHIIRRRIIFVLLGVAICTGITGIISLYIPPVYQAKTLLKVNNIATNNNNDIYNAQAAAVDYALLVTSPEVLRAATKKLPDISAGNLQQVISDSPVENTQIIEIRAQANEPQKAADRANVVASAFIQLQTAKETDRLQDTANLITQHIAAARFDLDTAQAYLNVLQNSHAAQASIAQQHSLVDTDQANYGLLLTNYSQLQVQKLQVATILSVVQAAQPPDAPVSPQPLISMLLAAAMSFLLMILLVLLLDWLDTTIKTAEDVANLTGLTPLGCIPSVHKTESANLLNLALQSNILIRDALNMVGTNLSVQHMRQRLLLVSGTRAGVGSSTVAAYLAIALAQAGIRVLLLDANPHRPLLHTAFRAPNTNGLSNRIGDVERFQEHPTRYPGNWLNRWKTPLTNLWLLPAGPSTNTLTPTTLPIQGLQQLKGWLLGEPQTVKEKPLIDLILCDTAPIGEGNDTYALSTIADGIIMVIEAAKEQKEALCNTHALHLKAPIVGVVINRQKAGQTSYYYTDPRNRESTTLVSQKMSVPTQKADIQTSIQHEDSLAPYEEPTVSNMPGITLKPPHIFTHKIAERPMTQALPLQSEAAMPATTRKLMQVTKLAPSTPILPVSPPASEQFGTSTRTTTIEAQPEVEVQMPHIETPAPFSLYTGQAEITTDPLVEANIEFEQEKQAARTAQPYKTQFRTRPIKRV